MRKEDRVLPPWRQYLLPQGFRVERAPRAYHVYFSYLILDDQLRPCGPATYLVAVFGAERWREVEPFCRARAADLARRLEHQFNGLRSGGFGDWLRRTARL